MVAHASATFFLDKKLPPATNYKDRLFLWPATTEYSFTGGLQN
jgi:hypothetical protein